MSTSSVGRPGKYQRSAGGLLAALVITVVAIGALLWFMGLFRDDVDNRPDRVDYLETVSEAQDAKLSPIYPAELPKGWIATGFDVVPGDNPTFEIRLLTDSDKFIGIRQEAEDVSTLIRQYVDEDASATDIYSARGSVAEAWQGYEDDGGDSAYASEVDGETVLVYGSASAADLREVIDSLTTEALDD
ncbi:DUF4245 domain-containing protein [Nocardioides humilatus]|uniref:DUF4245 domain-containing protein n=1 Tax=Nocardioides humilatus TaxID=2607660 RepID=A0A5B1LNW4_9ACTN|nr:DUF4245 family protein [Nocardioides humilatus]KAA1421329.1 DUF4245 domain-containing protein [Nocardioides humilatus]